MSFFSQQDLPIEVLDTLPNPVLVKDHETRYVWVNAEFERLFSVKRDDLVGKFDADVFVDRQVAQCNGGDLRVLDSGNVDEANETLLDPERGWRETITRKSRLTVGGQVYLVGVIHDVTDVTEINRRLEETTSQLEKQSAELRRFANIDSLTGCLNRRSMFDEAPDEFAAAGGRGGVAVLDLDDFKQINDTYGHAGGDAVLVHFAKLVRGMIRKSDLFARLGGEEFAILFPGASADEIERITERIRQEVDSHSVPHQGGSIDYTVSVGAVHATPPDAVAIDHWIAGADELLYQAKSEGRNRVIMGALAAA